MKIDYIKCHGNGNDFLLIDESKQPLGFNDQQLKDFAIAVCDRNGAIGADGVLLLKRNKQVDFSMDIYNSDGSQALMCGNGMRCAARLAFDLVSGKKVLQLETAGKIYQVSKEEHLAEGVPAYSVELSDISLEDEIVSKEVMGVPLVNQVVKALTDQYTFTAVSMPNPHLVSDLTSCDIVIDDFLNEVGGIAKNDQQTFPQGVNISAYQILEDGKIFVRTHERGVGLTASCGTANCASSISYSMNHPERFNQWTTVFNKGGVSKIFVKDSLESIFLLGNATFEYLGSMEYDTEGVGLQSAAIIEDRQVEKKAFADFLEKMGIR